VCTMTLASQVLLTCSLSPQSPSVSTGSVDKTDAKIVPHVCLRDLNGPCVHVLVDRPWPRWAAPRSCVDTIAHSNVGSAPGHGSESPAPTCQHPPARCEPFASRLLRNDVHAVDTPLFNARSVRMRSQFDSEAPRGPLPVLVATGGLAWSALPVGRRDHQHR
jgi:hypothetical protein